MNRIANILRHRNKDGQITSCTIRVFRGYDADGKKLPPFTENYKPAPGMTEKQIEKEVRLAATLFEKKCNQGYCLDGKQTFAEYAEYVLKCKAENGAKHRTMERYRDLLRRIDPAIGHIKLVDLRPQHLNEFYSQLRQPGIRKGGGKAALSADLQAYIKRKGISKTKLSEMSGVSATTLRTIWNGGAVSVSAAEKVCGALAVPIDRFFNVRYDDTPLSEKTVLEHHRLISTILAQAEKEMLIEYNPAAKVVNKPKADRKQEVNYLELSDLEDMRDCLDAAPLKWKVITHLLIVTGCRRGEIAGLKWNAVDFQRNELHICNTLLYTKDWGVYQDSPKTDTSDRVIPLPDESAELLREYRQYWEQLRTDSGDNWNYFITIKDGDGVERTEPADFLFVKEDRNKIGYPMNPDSITDWLDKFSERNGLPHINPHALRHTLASVLCVSGVDMVTISKWLGHKSVNTTMNFYEHILEKGRERVVNCISDVILNPGEDKRKKA